MHLLFYGCFFLLFLQPTSGQAPKPEFAECKNDYICFYSFGTALNRVDVNLLNVLGPSNVDVLFKIHLYNQKHYRVVLQSIKNDITSIIITRKEQSALTPSDWLSCEVLSGKAVFKVEDKPMPDSDSSMKPTLRCEYEINGKPEVLEGTTYAIEVKAAVLPANPTTAKLSITFTEIDFFCDPSKLVLRHHYADPAKAYTKLNVHLNNFHCTKQYSAASNGIWSKPIIEYLKEGTSQYVPVTTPTCERVDEVQNGQTKSVSKFRINGEDVDKAYVRCVTEAQYFCDYTPPSPPGAQELNRDPADRESNNPKKSSLSCPPSHPHFDFNGKQVKNVNSAKFECRNSMNKFTWYFDGRPLPTTGTKGHCTNKLQCPKIPSERMSSVRLEDGVPVCHDGGTLMVYQDNQPKEKIDRVECNEKLGKLYYYLIGGQQKMQWSSNLNVLCDYEGEKEAYKEERKETESTMLIIVLPIGLVVVLVTIAIMLFICLRRRKKMIAKANDIKKTSLWADTKSQRYGGKEGYKEGDYEPKDESKPGTTSEIEEMGVFKEKNRIAGEPLTIVRPEQKEMINAALLENESWKVADDKLAASYKVEWKEDCSDQLRRAKEESGGFEEAQVNIRASKATLMNQMRNAAK